MNEKKELEFQKLKICILTISSSRELSNDKSGDVLEERVLGFGHELFERKITKDNKDSIKNIIINWSKDKEIDVIITSGGTGLTETDVTPEALEAVSYTHLTLPTKVSV